MTTVWKGSITINWCSTKKFKSGDGSLREDLVLRSTDLTDVGNEFFGEVFPKWSAHIDRGGDIQMTTILLNGLNKLQM
ncbi:hypothetical protein ABGV42_04615 [Paenibacillus pabuli]|uniref:hypothetical protein n=1 Tax=Paenibacillus pabuli TaxID=1472 RepID=UPI0032427931